MGMYTECMFRARIKKEIPESVEKVIRYFFDDGEQPEDLPDHEFFKCSRWDYLFSCPAHHRGKANLISLSEGNRDIFNLCDIKNYDGEISKFFDWINPYLDTYPGACIGWSWYEEDDLPVLICAK